MPTDRELLELGMDTRFVLDNAGRVLHNNWDLYDTRHTVFQPMQMTPAQLEAGYWKAYRDFYSWGSILKGARAKPTWTAQLRHFAYAAGWKKFEPLWDFIIRLRRLTAMLPLLETILSEFGKRDAQSGIEPTMATGDGREAPVIHSTAL